MWCSAVCFERYEITSQILMRSFISISEHYVVSHLTRYVSTSKRNKLPLCRPKTHHVSPFFSGILIKFPISVFCVSLSGGPPSAIFGRVSRKCCVCVRCNRDFDWLQAFDLFPGCVKRSFGTSVQSELCPLLHICSGTCNWFSFQFLYSNYF